MPKLFIITTAIANKEGEDTTYWTPAYTREGGVVYFKTKGNDDQEILHEIQQGYIKEIKGPYEIFEKDKEKPKKK
jgi:hypothetical protein